MHLQAGRVVTCTYDPTTSLTWTTIHLEITALLSWLYQGPSIMGSEDIFNYYIGGLTLISTMVSIALYCRTYLAGAQIKVLDELLQETRMIYEKSSAEGLLPMEYKREMDVKLSQYVIKMLSLRARTSVADALDSRLEDAREDLKLIAYKANNFVDECVVSIRGLTVRIMRISERVKLERAHLVVCLIT